MKIINNQNHGQFFQNTAKSFTNGLTHGFHVTKKNTMYPSNTEYVQATCTIVEVNNARISINQKTQCTEEPRYTYTPHALYLD